MSFVVHNVMCCDTCGRKSEPFGPDRGYVEMFDRLSLLGWALLQPVKAMNPMPPASEDDVKLQGERYLKLDGRAYPTAQSAVEKLVVWCPPCADANDRLPPRASVLVELSWSTTLAFDGVPIVLRVPRNMSVRELIDDLRDREGRPTIGDWLEEVNAQHTAPALEQMQRVEHIELLDVTVANLDLVGERGNKD